MIHLDTSFLVDLLREHPKHTDGPAHQCLNTLVRDQLAISIHAVCEMYAGAALSRAPDAERARVAALCSALTVLAPDAQFPPEYAKIFRELRRRGQSVATMDLLIATAARLDAAPLVTRNVRDFERIPGLDVIAY